MSDTKTVPNGIYGGSVKAIGDLGGDTLTVTGPGIMLDEANSKNRDLYGEYFTKNTYFGKHKGDGVDAFFHHKQPLLRKSWYSGAEHIIPKRLFDFFKGLADHRFKNAVTTVFDEETSVLAATLVLNMRNEYEKFVGELASKGLLAWSSGSSPHVAEIDWKTGEIKDWPIVEFSLTPTPAEPRIRVETAKSFEFAQKFLLDAGSISEEDLKKVMKDEIKAEMKDEFIEAIEAKAAEKAKEEAEKREGKAKKSDAEDAEEKEFAKPAPLLEHNYASPEYWYEIGRRKAAIHQIDRLINEYDN